MIVSETIVTHGPNKLFDVTGLLEEAARRVGEGVAAVFSKGSTGALAVIPRGSVEEFEEELWSLVPVDGWEHPGNAYAHLRSTLIGTSLLVPVHEGKPCLPEGYGVFFVENQPANARRRKIFVAAFSTRRRSQALRGLP